MVAGSNPAGVAIKRLKYLEKFNKYIFLAKSFLAM